MATCKIHPLSADHISKLATLVDEKIGTMIGEAALKAQVGAKVSDLAPWYELRGVIAQMQESSGAKVEEKPARKARTRTSAPPTNETVIPSDTSGGAGDGGGVE